MQALPGKQVYQQQRIGEKAVAYAGIGASVVNLAHKMARPTAEAALFKVMNNIYTDPELRVRYHHCLKSAPTSVYRNGQIDAFKWLQKRYPALDLTRYVALQLKVNAACGELVKDDVLDQAYWKAARTWYTDSALEELTNFFKADKKAKLQIKARRRASEAGGAQQPRAAQLEHRLIQARREYHQRARQERPLSLGAQAPRRPPLNLPDAAPLLSGAGLLEHPSASSNQPEDAPAPLVELTTRLVGCPSWVSRDLEQEGMSFHICPVPRLTSVFVHVCMCRSEPRRYVHI